MKPLTNLELTAGDFINSVWAFSSPIERNTLIKKTKKLCVKYFLTVEVRK